MERVVKDKVKGLQQGERKSTLFAAGVLSLEEQLIEGEKELKALVEERREVSRPVCFVLLFLGA